jgi:hypothetical protein
LRKNVWSKTEGDMFNRDPQKTRIRKAVADAEELGAAQSARSWNVQPATGRREDTSDEVSKG